ncbi:MAG: hypothetical protein QQN63_00095 [Nitrosopumilus sp.]
MSTFLEVTNKVLQRFNEIPLTASTFANATGFHFVVKEAVNNSIREINRESFQWPFNQKTASVFLVIDQTFYDVPLNAKVLDFDTFTIKYIRSGEENFNVLLHTDYDRYIRQDYERDQKLKGDPAERVPLSVFQYGEQYGIAPIPSNTDQIDFTYWGWPDELILDVDEVSVPSRFDDVIVLGSMVECYEFRTMTQQAARVEGKFQAGIKNMRTLLLNDLTKMSDTRVGRM